MTTSEPARPPLDAARLTAAPWGRIEVTAATPSTNAVVADRARSGEPEALVLVTEHQTAGRGRLDRVWVTPARGALTFSVLLRPDAVAAERWPWLPLLAGVGVVRGVRRSVPAAALKWPNDVLVGSRKLAGILVERVDTASGPAAVVGVGVNVAMSDAELPVPTATSLLVEGGDTDRTALLLAILRELGSAYAEWVDAAGDAGAGLRAAYQKLCATLGSAVMVDLPAGESVTGEAVEVDALGRLVVMTMRGRTAVSAGDVVHVRAVPPMT